MRNADTNLSRLFDEKAAVAPDNSFLWAKSEGVYRPWSWRRVADEIQRIAGALVDAGLEPGDRVALIAENRPEWLISDLAIMRAGGITVPAYTTHTADDHAYLLDHAGVAMAICSSRVLARRFVPALERAPALRLLLAIDEDALEGMTGLPPTMTWSEALKRGEAAGRPAPGLAAAAGDTACLIYTSGSGGRPKGVMLTHRNILANAGAAAELLRQLDVGERDVFLSFLPLSHAYEHTAGQFLPIMLGAEIYYAEGVETLSTNLPEARPTVLTCVPRLFEVLQQRIQAAVDRKGGLSARLFELTLRLGRQRYEDGSLPIHLEVVDKLLDRLVRAKMAERFGGRLKVFVSGGAPLNREVGMFFRALGLPVLQGFGQTEAAPVVSVTVPSKARLEDVGPPLPGVEVRIARDGEILVRGPNVMAGYWKDQEATAEALRGGWLHTGDIGELTQEGHLRITDRKKDIIVISGGDNIAPQRVEGILQLEPEIAQALVYGDKRPYLVALIVPDTDVIRLMRRSNNPEVNGALEPDVVREAVEKAVKRASQRLAPYEKIRRFAVLDHAFSVENGTLTPTMKLRRPIIVRRYQSILDDLYGKREQKAAPKGG